MVYVVPIGTRERVWEISLVINELILESQND
jgi:hypothetical protein